MKHNYFSDLNYTCSTGSVSDWSFDVYEIDNGGCSYTYSYEISGTITQSAPEFVALATITLNGETYSEDTTVSIPHDGDPITNSVEAALDGNGSSAATSYTCEWSAGSRDASCSFTTILLLCFTAFKTDIMFKQTQHSFTIDKILN